MEIKITRDVSCVTAALVGRLDTPASQEVAPQFEELKADAAGTIVLDCSELSYISSSGLRLFLTIRKETAAKGGKVMIFDRPLTEQQVVGLTASEKLLKKYR